MGTIRAQVILHTDDNTPANYITNSLAFVSPGTFADFTGLTGVIKDFYDDITAAYLSSELAQNGHEIKYYDLPGTPPNYPIEEDTFNLAANPSGSPLPQECAIVLSFQGVRTPGFPQSRRRGRIYLGTWGASANTSGRPTAALVTIIATAATTFKTAVAALADPIDWAIWSVADQAPVAVDNGWIDNVWDTQRRRGLLETSRTTFS